LLLAALQGAIGLAAFFPRAIRIVAVTLGCLLSLAFWVVGQKLGGYYTGTATDPNTAPLFILLGLAVLGCTQLDAKLPQIFARIEAALIGREPVKQ
jgi:hypothetical protein